MWIVSFHRLNTHFNQLQKGVVIAQADITFPLLVPLVLPQGQGLIGILALGTRTNGRGYSHEERQEFKTLGNQAGTAIYIARLNMANQKELKQQLASLKARIEAIEARM